MKLATIALYALPLSTSIVVGVALFVVGAPEPHAGARLWGGPTEGTRALSLRLEVLESYRGVEAPLAAGEVELEAALETGRTLRWTGRLDESGAASVRLPLGDEPLAAPPRIVVRLGGKTIADGRIWLSVAEWLSRAERHGGFYPTQSKGELAIRVAPARGAMAVPFPERLLIDVRDAGGTPVTGASVHIEPDGFDLVDPKAPDLLLRTDARGRAVATVAPREHAPSLRVAVDEGGKTGSWYAIVPVVPGAFHASLDHGRLRIESPVVRETCYFALYTERERIAGGAVQLEPDGRGRARALVELPELPRAPIWAAVSSDPELRAETTIGWPLVGHPPEAPHETLVVPDRMLLDGVARGAKLKIEKQSRAKLIAAGFALLALLLASVIVVVRARAAESRLRTHLEASGTTAEDRERIGGGRGGMRLAVAVVCIALGFAMIALVALYRLG